MEVHHHAHTARKKWTHYLWEFLMLFLAVFCGFLAENQREHMVEHKREHQYMESMTEDLKTDTAELHYLLASSNKRLATYDSLRTLLKSPDKLTRIRELYYFFRPTTSYNLFIPIRRTIDQLESSGGLRLIRKANVSDSITAYYNQVKAAVGQGETWLRYFDQYHEIAFRVFDYSQIDTIFYEREKILTVPGHYTLLTTDEIMLKTLYNKLFALRFILYSYVSFLEDLDKAATSTLMFVKEKYHLE